MSMIALLVILHWGSLIGGAVLLSQALGWKVGVGIMLLVWFHKSVEKHDA